MKIVNTLLLILLASVAIFCRAEHVFASIEEAKTLFQNRAYEKAFSIFTDNSDQSEAKYYLGIILIYGLAGDKKPKLAIKHIEQAAKDGFLKASLLLGYLYETGDEVDQNFKEAMKWYLKAADLGNVRAQFNLALMYRRGRGVNKNDYKAVEWYRKASNCYIPAKNNLAFMLQNGLGVEKKDLESAIKLYTEAANANYASAQYNLAVAFVTGEGVEKNFVEAYKWFELAARNGHEKALSRRDFLFKLMEPEDIKKAGEEVINFKPSNASDCTNN